MHDCTVQSVHQIVNRVRLAVLHVDVLSRCVGAIKENQVLAFRAQLVVGAAHWISVEVETGPLMVIVVPIEYGHLVELLGQIAIAHQVALLAKVHHFVVEEALVLLDLFAGDFSVPVTSQLADNRC